MRHIVACILLLTFISTATPYAQERLYDLTIFGSLTTSSKLFHHSDDADELIRSQFTPINTMFSGGIDIRRTIEETGVQIGLSIEYISKTELFYLPIYHTNQGFLMFYQYQKDQIQTLKIYHPLHSIYYQGNQKHLYCILDLIFYF